MPLPESAPACSLTPALLQQVVFRQAWICSYCSAEFYQSLPEVNNKTHLCEFDEEELLCGR